MPCQLGVVFSAVSKLDRLTLFLNRIYRCGFSCELIQLETLTLAADKRLIAQMCGQVHCLYSLLPSATNYSLKHHTKGHSSELPRYSYDLSRKRFVLRCACMSSNSYLVRCLCFLCVTIAFIYFLFFCAYVCYVFSIKT